MYRKVICILILILATLALITQISLFFLGKVDLSRELLLIFEKATNAIMGIAAGIYLLQKNQRGLVLSKIWSALQIPIIIYGVNGVTAFGINFEQVIGIPITGSSLLQDFTLGINFFGIIMLLLVWRIRLSK